MGFRRRWMRSIDSFNILNKEAIPYIDRFLIEGSLRLYHSPGKAQPRFDDEPLYAALALSTSIDFSALSEPSFPRSRRRSLEMESEPAVEIASLNRALQELPEWDSYPPFERLSSIYRLNPIEKFTLFAYWSWSAYGLFDKFEVAHFHIFLTRGLGDESELYSGKKIFKTLENLRMKGIFSQKMEDDTSLLSYFPSVTVSKYLSLNDSDIIEEIFGKKIHIERYFKDHARVLIPPDDLRIVSRIIRNRNKFQILVCYDLSKELLLQLGAYLAASGLKILKLSNIFTDYELNRDLADISLVTSIMDPSRDVLAIPIDKIDSDRPVMIRRLGTENAFQTWLRDPPVSTIWLSRLPPRKLEVDPKLFDYVLCQPVPSQSTASIIWKIAVKKHRLSRLLKKDMVADLAQNFPIDSESLDSALQIWKSVISTRAPTRNKIDALKKILVNKWENSQIPPRKLAPLASYYDETLLVTDTPISAVEKALNLFHAERQVSRPQNLNIALIGPPGTGKTEWVKYITTKLDLRLVVARASDLLNPYVGVTEQNIARFFAKGQAPRTLLFLDEADSMFIDRKNARYRYEISFTNEFLSHLDQFSGTFVCATNFFESIDPAFLRRFAFKVHFFPLPPDRLWALVQKVFPDIDFTPSQRQTILSLNNLTPGDVRAVMIKLQYSQEVTAAAVVEGLLAESRFKSQRQAKPIGFTRD